LDKSPSRNQKKHALANEIVEVYSENFFKEIERISALVTEYNYIAMVLSL
jgi:hypothetical protein